MVSNYGKKNRWAGKTHQISKLVHANSEAKLLGVGVVLVDVLPVGLPDDVASQLLAIRVVDLAMLL